MKNSCFEEKHFEEMEHLKKINLRNFTLGGGVTHRIRMMISGAGYNCRRALRTKFFINFFTLRVILFID